MDMRKLLYIACMWVAMIPWLVSCANEEAPMEKVQVTFTAKIPSEADSRSGESFGKGSHVTELHCAIYEQGQNDRYTFVHSDVVRRSGDGFSYSPYLSKGKTYKIAFWAMASSAYRISSDLTDVQIPAMTCNDPTKEAFAGVSKPVEVDASYGAPIGVELKRPFALLNFATTMSSAQKAQKENMTAEVTITCDDGVAESYNVLTGEVTKSENTFYTFTSAAILGTECVNDHVTYIRLASCYVMPVVENMTIQAQIVVRKGAEEIGNLTTEPNIPLTVNYSTNLFGKMLE